MPVLMTMTTTTTTTHTHHQPTFSTTMNPETTTFHHHHQLPFPPPPWVQGQLNNNSTTTTHLSVPPPPAYLSTTMSPGMMAQSPFSTTMGPEMNGLMTTHTHLFHHHQLPFPPPLVQLNHPSISPPPATFSIAMNPGTMAQ